MPISPRCQKTDLFVGFLSARRWAASGRTYVVQLEMPGANIQPVGPPATDLTLFIAIDACPETVNGRSVNSIKPLEQTKISVR